MSTKRDSNLLITLLRAGDPAAADPKLSPIERTAMRQRVLDAGRERRYPKTWLVPATAAAMLLALALGVALRLPQEPPAARHREPTASPAASSVGQQIQFTTDGGTLVVWVLQPRATS